MGWGRGGVWVEIWLGWGSAIQFKVHDKVKVMFRFRFTFRLRFRFRFIFSLRFKFRLIKVLTISLSKLFVMVEPIFSVLSCCWSKWLT